MGAAGGYNAPTTGRGRQRRCMFGAREVKTVRTAAASSRTTGPSLSTIAKEEGCTSLVATSMLMLISQFWSPSSILAAFTGQRH
jgi:hypothetical protein